MPLVEILSSAAILGAIGLLFAILIAVAHRRFHVWEDPRIDRVTGLLPGTNCGACGFPGCRGFAEGLVAGKSTPAACTVMGADQKAEVAEFLGVDVGSAEQRVARVLCAGGTDVAVQNARYLGPSTCAAAAAVAGGGKRCSWGCLGLADCAVACEFDAIHMNDVGLPVVIPERCTACGDCVTACPRDLFVLMPVSHRLLVQCRSLLEGDAALASCRVACNACGRCAADLPQVVSMRNGLAVVDYGANELADPIATKRCPTGAIVWLEGTTQFAGAEARVKGAAA